VAVIQLVTAAAAVVVAFATPAAAVAVAAEVNGTTVIMWH